MYHLAGEPVKANISVLADSSGLHAREVAGSGKLGRLEAAELTIQDAVPNFAGINTVPQPRTLCEADGEHALTCWGYVRAAICRSDTLLVDYIIEPGSQLLPYWRSPAPASPPSNVSFSKSDMVRATQEKG